MYKLGRSSLHSRFSWNRAMWYLNPRHGCAGSTDHYTGYLPLLYQSKRGILPFQKSEVSVYDPMGSNDPWYHFHHSVLIFRSQCRPHWTMHRFRYSKVQGSDRAIPRLCLWCSCSCIDHSPCNGYHMDGKEGNPLTFLLVGRRTGFQSPDMYQQALCYVSYPNDPMVEKRWLTIPKKAPSSLYSSSSWDSRTHLSSTAMFRSSVRRYFVSHSRCSTTLCPVDRFACFV